MTDERDKLDPLEIALDDARRDVPQPSAAFMARVLNDAMTEQAEFGKPRIPSSKRGLMPQLLRALGGWPSAAGLSMAGLAGLWIGISSPAGLDAMTGGYLGADTTAYLIDTSAEGVLGLADVTLGDEAM